MCRSVAFRLNCAGHSGRVQQRHEVELSLEERESRIHCYKFDAFGVRPLALMLGLALFDALTFFMLLTLGLALFDSLTFLMLLTNMTVLR